jgi:large subunit ribosomal protein L15
MPLIRRLPKRGFKNMFKSEFSIVNVGSLEVFDADTVIDADFLLSNRVIGKIEKDGLKVLGEGELTKPLTVKAAKFSKTAIEKIEKAGGKIEVL